MVEKKYFILYILLIWYIYNDLSEENANESMVNSDWFFL